MVTETSDAVLDDLLKSASLIHSRLLLQTHSRLHFEKHGAKNNGIFGKDMRQLFTSLADVRQCEKWQPFFGSFFHAINVSVHCDECGSAPSHR